MGFWACPYPSIAVRRVRCSEILFDRDGLCLSPYFTRPRQRPLTRNLREKNKSSRPVERIESGFPAPIRTDHLRVEACHPPISTLISSRTSNHREKSNPTRYKRGLAILSHTPCGPNRPTARVERLKDMTVGDIYKKVIRDDDGICENCFRRTHDRYERNYRLEPYQVDFGEWDVHPIEVQGVEITLPDGETEVIGGPPDDKFGNPENLTPVPGDEPAQGLVIICKCGFRWAPEHEVEEWKNRPLPKKKFFEYAENFKERLDEAEVTYDEDAFDQYLDEKKSDPDEQFADDRILSKAVEYASKVASMRA